MGGPPIGMDRPRKESRYAMNDKIIWQIIRESFVPLECVIGWSGHDRDLPTEGRKVLGQLRDADGWGAATRRKLARYDQHLPQTASLSWGCAGHCCGDTRARTCASARPALALMTAE